MFSAVMLFGQPVSEETSVRILFRTSLCSVPPACRFSDFFVSAAVVHCGMVNRRGCTHAEELHLFTSDHQLHSVVVGQLRSSSFSGEFLEFSVIFRTAEWSMIDFLQEFRRQEIFLLAGVRPSSHTVGRLRSRSPKPVHRIRYAETGHTRVSQPFHCALFIDLASTRSRSMYASRK